jgi:hypothetical protein
MCKHIKSSPLDKQTDDILKKKNIPHPKTVLKKNRKVINKGSKSITLAHINNILFIHVII